MLGRSLRVVVAVVLVTACSGKPNTQEVAAGIMEKLHPPVKVDDVTQLDKVTGISDHELGYFLTLTSITKAELAPDLGAKIEGHLRESACTDPNYKTLFEVGVGVVIIYQTSDHAPVVRVTLGPKDCAH